jgi:hypothetical protein
MAHEVYRDGNGESGPGTKSGVAVLIHKGRAFAFHLGASAAMIGLFLTVVYFVWYPQPYFDIENVWDVIRIVVGVDLVLGPALTFIVYSPRKPSLRFDLGVIIVLQVTALVWGIYVTYTQRPLYVAFAGDMFTVVAASDVRRQPPPDTVPENHGWGGPLPVYVRLPQDMNTLLSLSLEHQRSGGKFASMTSAYEPYERHREEVLASGVDIRARGKLYPALARGVEAVIGKLGGTLDDYAFVPVEGRNAFAFLVVRRSDGQLMTAVTD